MPLLAVGVLAALTYTFRIAGPLLRHRVTVPPATERLLASATAVLLLALAVTSALTQDGGFAGWARPSGVLTAGILAARRAPFPVVVIAAAMVTALLRLAGVHLRGLRPAPERLPPGRQVTHAPGGTLPGERPEICSGKVSW